MIKEMFYELTLFFTNFYGVHSLKGFYNNKKVYEKNGN